MLSVVIPAFNEESVVEKTCTVLAELLAEENIGYELVFVNDGSSDNTETILSGLSDKDERIHYVSFSRNFGKEAAIQAGLAFAKGDCVAVMDCDLQHPPETLIEMFRLWEQGYEVIEGIKRTRGSESGAHRFAVKTFYRIMSNTTGTDMSQASDFKLLDRKAVDALLALPEYHTFFRALSGWVGFKTVKVEFDVREREAGKSKWSTGALVKYAVNNIMAFSSAPLNIVTCAGVGMFLIAIFLGIQTLVRYFSGNAAEGFTTVIILILFIGSIIMIGIGIIGMYISRIYDEVKKRPKYIVSRYK